MCAYLSAAGAPLAGVGLAGVGLAGAGLGAVDLAAGIIASTGDSSGRRALCAKHENRSGFKAD